MLQVQQLLTGCITQEIKGRLRPVTRSARTPLIDHDTGGGGGTGVRMLTATLQPLIGLLAIYLLYNLPIKHLSRPQSQEVNKSFPCLSSHLISPESSR